MSGIRPESMQGKGTSTLAPIPVTASITAQHHNPAVTATGAVFSFGPTDRAVVEKAVDAFKKVMEEADGAAV